MRSRDLLVLYALLALLTFTTLEALTFGTHGLQYAHDVFDDGGAVPRLAMTSASWLANGITWWNPAITAGNDSLAQFALSPIAPDTVLAIVAGPFVAYAVTAWLMALVAGLGMHLFLRDTLRLPHLGCLLGATFYLFGFWHYIMGFAAVTIPLLLWLADRAVTSAPRRWTAIVGWVGVGALALYDGNSQLALIVGLLQLAWLLFVRTDVSLRSRCGMWLGAWLLTLAVFGPVLLAQLVFLPGSERSIWDLDYLYDARLGPAIANSNSFYASIVIGLPVAQGIGGSPGRYGTFFPGALGLFLFGLGIAVAAQHPRDRRQIFLVALLIAVPLLDLVAVLITPLQQELGFLRSFQLVRIRHLMPFAVAAALAMGAAAVLDPANRTRLRPYRHIIAAIVFASMALSAWQLVVSAQRIFRIVRGGDSLGIAGLGWLLAIVALGAGLLALGAAVAMIRRPQAIGRTAIVALAFLFVLDRSAFAQAERLTDENLASFADRLEPTAGQKYILERSVGSTERVLTVGDHANRMAVAGLLQADGYQAIYPLRYHDVFGALIAPHLAIDPIRRDYFDKWGARAYAFGPEIDPEIADLLGVRWIYARGAAPTTPGLIARFSDGDVTVLENTDILPRAFVADKIVREATTDALVAALVAAKREDLRRTAYLLESDLAGSNPDMTRAGGESSGRAATIASYTPDRVVVDVPDGPAGLLVLTDVAAPGWVAEVDGHSRPILPVDLAFRAVGVPSGVHRVVFRYAPASLSAGLALAFGSLVGLCAGAILLRRRDGAGDSKGLPRTRARPRPYRLDTRQHQRGPASRTCSQLS